MENNSIQETGFLNRDVIKYLAMLTMLFNHVANMFLPEGVLHEVLVDIGYFTAPTMCYFLVEGFSYTRSKKRYGLRLLAFALLSQIPYEWAFHMESLNMLFTLFLCFGILVVMEKPWNMFSKWSLIALLILFSLWCDWPLMAPIFTLLFAMQKKNCERLEITNPKERKAGLAWAFFVCYLLLFGLEWMAMAQGYGYDLLQAAGHAALAGLGVAASGLVILFLYNGKRAKYGRNFSKWFFYLFYPGHLLVLVLVRDFLL